MEMWGVCLPVYVALTVVAVVLLYMYMTWNHDFFTKRGIPGPKPNPFFGNTLFMASLQSFRQWKQTYGNVVGVFFGRTPVYVISDLDILKGILVKDFNNFRNRVRINLIPEPFNLGVFFLEDAAWKRVRNIITPSFSLGKLRAKCSAINECALTLTNNFRRVMNKGRSVNMKEYFGAYTMDVIAKTAFGVKVDSQNDLNNPFTYNSKKIFDRPSVARGSLLMFFNVFPSLAPLARALGFSAFPRSVTDFFLKSITDMIKVRQLESKEEREKRIDFLQLLMDAEVDDDSEFDTQMVNGASLHGHISRKQSARRLTPSEIVGQGILFVIAGYETTASTLGYASYCLAKHPDVQEKVYQEIRDVLGDDEPDYDKIHKLNYMENVIKETLRLYPPAFILDRHASETVTIKGVTITKGHSILIPAFLIHRDPDVFPNPEDFKPERFDDNKNPLSFLSFGYGPRICIGMRLALVEAKIALVQVMRKVKFEAGPDTPDKLTFGKGTVLELVGSGTVLLTLSPRC